VNKYELTIILDGKSGAAKTKKITETLEGILKIYKGKIAESKEWGVKDLIYKIDKSTSGLYLFFEIELAPEGVKALNDKLRVDTEILRFLLIRKN
jgi:small subunit ribosomal protein S6